MIESIRIQNYKALRDVTLHLTPIHVLIGKNDSGKTSILQAITALCRSVDHELARAFVGRWMGYELVWQQQNDRHVAFDVLFGGGSQKSRYELEVSFTAGARSPRILSEWVVVNGQRHSLGQHGSNETLICRTYRDSTRGQNDVANAIQHTHDLLSKVRTCRWTAGMLSLPVAYEGQAARFDIAPNGFGLPLLLDDILGDDMHRFLEMVQQYQMVFPHVKTVKLVREEGYKLPPDDAEEVPKLKPGSGKGIRFDFNDGNVGVPASQVSDGMLTILAYLAVLYSPMPPRTLLIEEPENGVHPERLLEVIELIRQIGGSHSGTQVVLTTHSPHLLSHFAPDEVTLCHKENDGSVSLHRLSDSSAVQKQQSIFTLGEIWTGEGDDDLAKSTSATEATSP